MVPDMTNQDSPTFLPAGLLLLSLILPTAALGADKPKLPIITHYEMRMQLAIDKSRVESACRLTIKNTTDKPLQVVQLLLNRGYTVLDDTV